MSGGLDSARLQTASSRQWTPAYYGTGRDIYKTTWQGGSTKPRDGRQSLTPPARFLGLGSGSTAAGESPEGIVRGGGLGYADQTPHVREAVWCIKQGPSWSKRATQPLVPPARFSAGLGPGSEGSEMAP